MMSDAAEGTMTYATYMVGESSQPEMILPDLTELDAAMVVDAGTATSGAVTITATSAATSAHHHHSSVLLGRPVMGIAGSGGGGAVQVIGSGGGGGSATVQIVGGGGAVQLVGGGGSMVHVPPGSRFVVLNSLGTPVGTLDASGRMTALNSDGSGDASLGVVLVGSPMPTHSNNNSSSSNISTSNNNSCGIDTSGGLALPLGTLLASVATNNAVVAATATDAGGVVTSLCGGGSGSVGGKRPSSGGGGGSKVKIKREAEGPGPSSSGRSGSARSSGHRTQQSGGRLRPPAISSTSSILPIPYNPMDEFPHHHHLTKTQVEGLFMVLGPHYTNPGRRAPLKDFVLASLVLLSTKDSYREMSERMVFKSRGWMHKTIHLFCQLLVKHLSCLVEWPSGDDLKECLRGFQLIAGVPGVIGAMDSCHMAITKAPVGKSSSFYSNPMQFHSIHLLAVADHRSKFTYINVGRPGSFHESKVFKRSSLCQIIEGQPLGIFPEKTHIIADSAFPLSDYVLTPYPTGSNSNDTTALSNPGSNLPRHQKQFNAKVLLTRQPVVLAFSVLRAKWQRLRCLEMQRVTNMSIAIKTCCILHNICVYNNGYTQHQDAAAPAGGGPVMDGGEGDDEHRVTVEVEYEGPSPYSSLRKRDMIALYMEGQQVPWGEA